MMRGVAPTLSDALIKAPMSSSREHVSKSACDGGRGGGGKTVRVHAGNFFIADVDLAQFPVSRSLA